MTKEGRGKYSAKNYLCPPPPFAKPYFSLILLLIFPIFPYLSYFFYTFPYHFPSPEWGESWQKMTPETRTNYNGHLDS